jgi:hypothetical protein
MNMIVELQNCSLNEPLNEGQRSCISIMLKAMFIVMANNLAINLVMARDPC